MRQTKESLSEATASAWLHLLKKTLIRYPLDDADREMTRELHGVSPALRQEIERWIEHNQQGKLQESGDVEARASGRDWPATAETMIGLFRMDSLHSCLLDLLHRKVPGDLAEVGVWRGGAGIMMRAVLKAFGEKRRKVWLADSFQGFPPPDAKRYPMDAADIHATHPELAVLQETVKQNFKRYGLLDEQVRFLPGWFRDTLPTAPIQQIALLHLDCDMYESTTVALHSLYPKLSSGGYVIVDDYGALPSCRQAVTDFRNEFAITAEVRHIDWTGVFWQVPLGPEQKKATRPKR